MLLANYGSEGDPEPVMARISHETLADLIGTTRSRVSFFMNKFRRLGFIDYDTMLTVHSSLVSVVDGEQPVRIGGTRRGDACSSVRAHIEGG